MATSKVAMGMVVLKGMKEVQLDWETESRRLLCNKKSQKMYKWFSHICTTMFNTILLL